MSFLRSFIFHLSLFYSYHMCFHMKLKLPGRDRKILKIQCKKDGCNKGVTQNNDRVLKDRTSLNLLPRAQIFTSFFIKNQYDLTSTDWWCRRNTPFASNSNKILRPHFFRHLLTTNSYTAANLNDVLTIWGDWVSRVPLLWYKFAILERGAGRVGGWRAPSWTVALRLSLDVSLSPPK